MRQAPEHSSGEYRKAAHAREDEYSALASLAIELSDALDEIGAVGEVEVVDAVDETGLDDAVRVLAVALERAGCIDHQVWVDGTDLREHIAIAIEAQRTSGGPEREALAEGLCFRERAAGNQQGHARVAG